MTDDEITEARLALRSGRQSGTAFDAECREARKMAESLGLLSLEFVLCDGSLMTEVGVTNRKSGLARRYPRLHWLVALREELHGGLLGRPQPVGAGMQRRLELARGAGGSSAD